jgi:Sporulation and spore germination
VSRGLKITIGILTALVLLSLITLPGLRQAMQRISRSPIPEQQARREVMQAPISTPTDVKARAQIYWLSASSTGSLAATPVEIPLSADPVERCKQLLIALIVMAPGPERRTLPADVTLLAFYIQPDGTGIADFSDELATGTPSGILSEQLAVDSITQTLGANGTSIQKLKILIHGQDADTLAGHLDISGLFPVASAALAAAQDQQAGPGAAAPAVGGAVQSTTQGPSTAPPEPAKP